jgi:hypothetical protein
MLPRDGAQEQQAIQTIQAHHAELRDGLLLAVAAPPGDALPAHADFLAWRWVKDNTPELAGDPYAREEVSRQLERAKRRLRQRLSYVTNLSAIGGTPMPWFTNQGQQRLRSGKPLLSFLGQECLRIYHSAPRIRNELINRDSPSSAAVAARTKLVEAMASAPLAPHLDMDATKRPAEMALYLSILKAGNIHVPRSTGWQFEVPQNAKQDECNLIPSFNAITRTLRDAGLDALVPLPQVFEMLALKPHGVRQGLIPFVIAISGLH